MSPEAKDWAEEALRLYGAAYFYNLYCNNKNTNVHLKAIEEHLKKKPAEIINNTKLGRLYNGDMLVYRLGGLHSYYI